MNTGRIARQWLWVLSLVAMTVPGLGASHEQPAQPSVLASPTELTDSFGGVSLQNWHLLNRRDNEVVQLVWMEAAYSPYDVMQSRNALQGRCAAVGLIIAHDKAIRLVGYGQLGRPTVLVEVGLVLPADHAQAPWPALIEGLRQANREGGVAVESGVQHELFDPRGRNVHLYTLADSGFDLTPAIELRHDAATSSDADDLVTVNCWLGRFLGQDGTSLDGRLLTMSPAQAPLVNAGYEVSLTTWRLSQRRLEGALPAGCPWESRASLVRTLQRLDAAGIDWSAGAYDDQAKEIVEQDCGQRLTQEQFVDHLERTFGSLADAVASCCPFPEARHMPMIQVSTGHREMLVGAALSEESQQPLVIRTTMTDRLAPTFQLGPVALAEFQNGFVVPGIDSVTPTYTVAFTKVR